MVLHKVRGAVELHAEGRKPAHFGAGEESAPQYNRGPPVVTLVHALMEKVHLAGCNASEWTCWPLYSVAGQRARRS